MLNPKNTQRCVGISDNAAQANVFKLFFENYYSDACLQGSQWIVADWNL